MSNTQQAKCQPHSSPNKPTLTQGFSRGENNCLFKCFFITSTSNLATHEVCHEEREIGSQLSPPVDSSPKKKPSPSAFLAFFLLCFVFSTLTVVFQVSPSIRCFYLRGLFPSSCTHTLISSTDRPFNSTSSLCSLTFKCTGTMLVPLFFLFCLFFSLLSQQCNKPCIEIKCQQ